MFMLYYSRWGHPVGLDLPLLTCCAASFHGVAAHLVPIQLFHRKFIVFWAGNRWWTIDFLEFSHILQIFRYLSGRLEVKKERRQGHASSQVRGRLFVDTHFSKAISSSKGKWWWKSNGLRDFIEVPKFSDNPTSFDDFSPWKPSFAPEFSQRPCLTLRVMMNQWNFWGFPRISDHSIECLWRSYLLPSG